MSENVYNYLAQILAKIIPEVGFVGSLEKHRKTQYALKHINAALQNTHNHIQHN